MRRTVPPSAEIEEQIDQLLAVGVGENPRESRSELPSLVDEAPADRPHKLIHVGCGELEISRWTASR